jgi:hypothetical protein
LEILDCGILAEKQGKKRRIIVQAVKSETNAKNS